MKKKILVLTVLTLLITGFAAASDENVDFTLLEPDDGDDILYSNRDITFEGSVASTPSGEVDIFIDGSLQSGGTKTHPGASTQTYSWNYELSPGSHTWEMRFISDDTGHAYFSTFHTFTVQDADISFNLANPKDGENVGQEPEDVTFEYDISTNADATIELVLDGNVINTDSVSGGSTNTFTHTESGLSAGTYDWKVRAVYDDGTQESSTQSFTVAEESTKAPSVTHVAPDNGETFSIPATTDTETVTFEWGVDSFDESGTSYLYLNGTQISTKSFPSQTSNIFTHDEVLQPGYYEWQAKAVTNDHTVTASPWDFNIEQESLLVNTSLVSPTNNTEFTILPGQNSRNITFEWVVESEESGDTQLYVDNNLIYQDSFNAFTTTQFSFTDNFSAGNHTWHTEAATANGFGQSQEWNFEVNPPAPFADLALLYPQKGRSIPFNSGIVNFEFAVSASHSGDVLIQANRTTVETVEYTAGTSRVYNVPVKLESGTYNWRIVLDTDEFTESTSENKFKLEPRQYDTLLGQAFGDLVNSFEEWFAVDNETATSGAGIFTAMILTFLLTIPYAWKQTTGLVSVALVNLFTWITVFSVIGIISETFVFIIIVLASGVVGYIGVKWVRQR